MIAKVEVFIPPPVELEEDPTNIKNNIRIKKGTPRPKPSAALKSTVLKPDVRVTDWNREVIIDSPKFSPPACCCTPISKNPLYQLQQRSVRSTRLFLC